MGHLDFLIDLHRDGDRQGPGGGDETRTAVKLAGLFGKADLRIADIGCGAGASARLLAADLDARITAVDLMPAFLARLAELAAREGLADRIETLAASMDALPFEDESLDAIWSEGAIYNIGFERGISDWRRFLKPGGVLAVSELTWLTSERPDELDRYWSQEYPEVATASAKIAALEAAGYALLGYFPLPERCWIDNYYRPLQEHFAEFLARHDSSEAARAIVAAEGAEIALYERFSTYYGYGFYVARRLPD